MSGPDPCRSVVVVGGGLAGVMFTIHLLRRAEGPLAVTILEPRDRLGAGVAYSCAEPCHVTNVPAASMSVDPEDPGAFVRWLGGHGHAPTGNDPYPRRWLFGDYVGEILAEAARGRPDVAITHVRQHAVAIARKSSGYVVETDGGVWTADAVALATGNPTPLWPDAIEPVAHAPCCIADPWAPGVLARVPGDARVLVVGTGLTMGDTVAVLRAGGHRGAVVALSRRGKLARRGLAVPTEPYGDFGHPPSTALGLLRLFRAEVRRASAAGISWHAVLTAARREAWSLWAALPQPERRRFVRHLRLYYEIHRHVMAAPIHDRVAAEQRGGSLQVVAGRIRHARLSGSGVEVDVRPRGAGADAVRRERFDVVVNCTGPAYSAVTRADPLWAALTRDGLVRPDAAGLGPDVDRHGRAVGGSGAVQPDLLLVGTLARSAFGELTGAREIAAEARLSADGLLDAWGS